MRDIREVFEPTPDTNPFPVTTDFYTFTLMVYDWYLKRALRWRVEKHPIPLW